VLHAIDRFSFFQGVLHLRGWVHGGERVRGLELLLPGGRRHPIRSFGLPSPDVAAVHGEDAGRARFDEKLTVAASISDVIAATLRVAFTGGGTVELTELGRPVHDPVHALYDRFHALVRERPAGRLLEVGSRARSGIIRRDIAPAGWDYSGLDVLAGPNVDVVGDAHRVSSLYPASHFDAVMSFSVLEHLMMPWKFVLELNRVLKPGAIGVFTTHQCWPLHDQPWDFWRFSDQAWTGLLNAATGFEIVDARLGEPAFVVAEKCHPATAFAETAAASLSSGVLFRKIGETALEWPVELGDLTRTHYPPDTD